MFKSYNNQELQNTNKEINDNQILNQFIKENTNTIYPFETIEINSEIEKEGEAFKSNNKRNCSNKETYEIIDIQNNLSFVNVNDEIDFIISDYLKKIFSNDFQSIEKERLNIEEELNNEIMQKKFLYFINQITLPQKLTNPNSVNELTNIIQCFLNSQI